VYELCRLLIRSLNYNPDLFNQPKRWVSFWEDMGSSSVLALDMVKDEHSLYRILSAISQPQKWPPSRSWCMQCKGTIGTFARALHCRHCGRFVCGDCSPGTLTPDYFPKDFDVDENSWVCRLCEKILVSRKESGGRNGCSTPLRVEQDDFHSTQMNLSFQESGELSEF
jgi:hypothetical protein